MERLLRTSSVLVVLLLGAAALAQYPVYNPFIPNPYVVAPVYLPAPYLSNMIVAPFTGQTASVYTSPFGNSVSLNGVAGPWEYAIAGLTFSPNGTRLGYLAQTVPGGPWFAVIDGRFSPTYYAVTGLTFSTNGARVGYLAQSVPGGAWFAVIDGVVGPPFSSVDSLAFSPDNLHVAYNAFNGITGQWVAVVDGIATPMTSLSYPGLSTGSNSMTFLVDPFSGRVVTPLPSPTGGTTGTSSQTPRTADQVILGG
jgi:hypothetical protein